MYLNSNKMGRWLFGFSFIFGILLIARAVYRFFKDVLKKEEKIDGYDYEKGEWFNDDAYKRKSFAKGGIVGGAEEQYSEENPCLIEKMDDEK